MDLGTIVVTTGDGVFTEAGDTTRPTPCNGAGWHTGAVAAGPTAMTVPLEGAEILRDLWLMDMGVIGATAGWASNREEPGGVELPAEIATPGP
mmetsp:Transcript_45936/g.106085  ORF Transcript_45936/g.106085 Transcript_45936/m.106085 type:complete len:93 (+) Transcript_45936:59-337(+)